MPPSDLQRRSVYFFIFAGTVTLILILLPFLESALQTYVLGHLELKIVDQRLLTLEDGEPGMMTNTIYGLTLNLFHIAKILLWMALVIAVVRFVVLLLFKTALRGSHSEISTLLRTVISVTVYIVAFFIIFQSQYPNVQLAPLFTGSTIIGIVVGLALQDTLGNLFAGIAVQADQPFQVGDVLTFENRTGGVIESVSWRGIRIRTFQNKLIILSNSDLGKRPIEVAPKDNLNARIVFFNTVYSDSPAKTIQVVREAVRQIDNVSQKIRPIVRIREFGESGLEWEVKYWAENYKKYNDTDAVIRQRIWYAFNRENIHFAYPTRTVYTHNAETEPVEEEVLDSTVERLSRIPIFTPLSNEELHKLAKTAKDRIFAPGEPIVRLGGEGNSMFVITRGRVDIQVLQGEETKTVNSLGKSDYFGEMSLLTGEPRTATVVASEETQVLQINKSALKPIFEANPDLVDSICRMIEERKLALDEVSETRGDPQAEPGKGVMASIRKFFGLK